MALWSNTDAANSKPTWLTAAQAAKCFFVSTEEAQVATNKARGITGAGWWLVDEYTDSAGNTRYKTECLVAMSVANATSGDAADDATVADAVYTITIGTQPANQNTSSGAATFTVVATTDGPANTLSYQWQLQSGGAGRWANVSGATSASLVLAGQTADEDGDKYRVKITGADGEAEVTSAAATLTFVD